MLNYFTCFIVTLHFGVNFVNGYSAELECFQPHLEILTTCCQEPNYQGSETKPSKCNSNKQTCLFECIFNETKLLPNGEIDMPGIRAQIQTELSNDPEFIPIMTKGFETCVMKLQNKRYQMRAENDECNPFAVTFFACVQSYTLSNCPESKWISSTMCNSAKEEIQKCFYKI